MTKSCYMFLQKSASGVRLFQTATPPSDGTSICSSQMSQMSDVTATPDYSCERNRPALEKELSYDESIIRRRNSSSGLDELITTKKQVR